MIIISIAPKSIFQKIQEASIGYNINYTVIQFTKGHIDDSFDNYSLMHSIPEEKITLDHYDANTAYHYYDDKDFTLIPNIPLVVKIKDNKIPFKEIAKDYIVFILEPNSFKFSKDANNKENCTSTVTYSISDYNKVQDYPYPILKDLGIEESATILFIKQQPISNISRENVECSIRLNLDDDIPIEDNNESNNSSAYDNEVAYTGHLNLHENIKDINITFSNNNLYDVSDSGIGSKISYAQYPDKYYQINIVEKDIVKSTIILIPKELVKDYYPPTIFDSNVIKYCNSNSSFYFTTTNYGQVIDMCEIITRMKDFIGSMPDQSRYYNKVNAYMTIVIDYNGEEGSLNAEDPSAPIDDIDEETLVVINHGFSAVTLKVNPNSYFKLYLALPEELEIDEYYGIPEGINFDKVNKVLDGYYMSNDMTTMRFIVGKQELIVNIIAHSIEQHLI